MPQYSLEYDGLKELSKQVYIKKYTKIFRAFNLKIIKEKKIFLPNLSKWNKQKPKNLWKNTVEGKFNFSLF